MLDFEWNAIVAIYFPEIENKITFIGKRRFIGFFWTLRSKKD